MDESSVPGEISAAPTFSALLLQELNFEHIPDGMIELERSVPRLEFAPGTLIMTEGEEGDCAYLIASGEIEVWRKNRTEVLAKAGPGTLLGELALMSGKPRSASAWALNPVCCWKIDRETYDKARLICPQLETLIARKVYTQLSNSHAALLQQFRNLEIADKRHRELAFFFVSITLVLSGYSLLSAIVDKGLPHGGSLSFWFGRVVELVGLIVVLRMAVRDGFDRASMGLTLKHFGPSVGAAIIFTLPAMAAMAYARAHFYPMEAGVPLVNWKAVTPSYYAYAIVAPLQELIARGVVMNAIVRLIPGRRRGPLAVLISSMIFATLHLHLGLSLPLISLGCGLVWGAIFLRWRNLAGISISHFLLGSWAGVLGLWAFWT
jgi:CRP-like cAMP-binding protein